MATAPLISRVPAQNSVSISTVQCHAVSILPYVRTTQEAQVHPDGLETAVCSVQLGDAWRCHAQSNFKDPLKQNSDATTVRHLEVVGW